MIKLRKHIAYLLFGIFFFPILFQSVHVVWHHSHGDQGEHTLCAQTITRTDFQSNNKNVSEKEKTCPICEYQFSINDLPKISFFNPAIPENACNYLKIAKQQQYKQVFSDKTPRAPPVYFS
ncbi:MAG: hypothetical protein JXR53_05795 [Bacteroidales bacterium]|nr:hypothetical protein [Bacteroidales bacterium]